MKFNRVVSLAPVLFLFMALSASGDTSTLNCKDEMDQDPLVEISGKVISFLQRNPTRNDLSIQELLKEEVINENDYNYLQRNEIKYNPPSSVGPNDNYMSLFDRENEDGTSTHILYDLVDKSDPNITKSGSISLLNKYLTEWYEYDADKKTIFVFNDDNFYYFTIWYTDNEYWKKQHGLSLHFSKNNEKDIEKIKNILLSRKIDYRDYVSQSELNIEVMLPPDLAVIKSLCTEILVRIYSVKQNDVINYTPHGFRFSRE